MCTYHAEFQIDRGMNYDAAVKVMEQEVVFFPSSLPSPAAELRCTACYPSRHTQHA